MVAAAVVVVVVSAVVVVVVVVEVVTADKVAVSNSILKICEHCYRWLD